MVKNGILNLYVSHASDHIAKFERLGKPSKISRATVELELLTGLDKAWFPIDWKIAWYSAILTSSNFESFWLSTSHRLHLPSTCTTRYTPNPSLLEYDAPSIASTSSPPASPPASLPDLTPDHHYNTTTTSSFSDHHGGNGNFTLDDDDIYISPEAAALARRLGGTEDDDTPDDNDPSATFIAPRGKDPVAWLADAPGSTREDGYDGAWHSSGKKKKKMQSKNNVGGGGKMRKAAGVTKAKAATQKKRKVNFADGDGDGMEVGAGAGSPAKKARKRKQTAKAQAMVEGVTSKS